MSKGVSDPSRGANGRISRVNGRVFCVVNVASSVVAVGVVFCFSPLLLLFLSFSFLSRVLFYFLISHFLLAFVSLLTFGSLFLSCPNLPFLLSSPCFLSLVHSIPILSIAPSRLLPPTPTLFPLAPPSSSSLSAQYTKLLKIQVVSCRPSRFPPT